MKIQISMCFYMIFVSIICAVQSTNSHASIILETATLGQTNITPAQGYSGEVPGINVHQLLFVGVRFQLDSTTVLESVGGHFIGLEGGSSFFAAVIELEGATDLPNSADLTSPDVLATAVLEWPAPTSVETTGHIDVTLSPGWYALVFGSGLFGTEGVGAAVLNGTDIGSPSYIIREPNFPGNGWEELSSNFSNFRLTIEGHTIPEPSTLLLTTLSSLMFSNFRLSKYRNTSQ